MDHQLIAQAGAVAGGIDSQTVIRAAALIGAGLGAIGVGVPGILKCKANCLSTASFSPR